MPHWYVVTIFIIKSFIYSKSLYIKERLRQPTGQIFVHGIFVEHSHDACGKFSRKKFPMKYWGIFPNNVPGILNIGMFPECSMNILPMFFKWTKKCNNSFL